VQPVRKALTYRIEQPGEIQAFERTPIYARISGYVLKLGQVKGRDGKLRDLDIGDWVNKDQVLAELSVPEMDAELSQKKALVVQAQAEVEQAKKLYEAAAANLESAVAKVKEAESSQVRAVAERRRAESQYQRMKGSPAVISREVLDESRLGVEAAKAAVAEVEARVKSAEATRVESAAKAAKAKTDIGVAEARLQVAQADERRVAALVGYAQLRAPFAGKVTWRKVDPGHLLSVGGAGGKGEPVFVVERTDPVRVFVDVPENDAVLVTDGTPAVVRVQALKGEEFPGKVTRSAWSLDPKARTLRTEIDVPNPAGRLRPGMYANSTITVEHTDVLAVPASAVLTKGEQTFCYQVEGDKAVRLLVRVGLCDGQFVELVKKRKPGREGRWEDFTGEEKLVVNPMGLTEGQKVGSGKP
jgi:multidrug efflux pump subunit AcrA (membrane-fusion protein)